MAVEIVTKEDLQIFRKLLLEDLKLLLVQQMPKATESIEGLKTKHVRKLLDCSINKLTLLRVTGKIRYKKIGGTLYYNKERVKIRCKQNYADKITTNKFFCIFTC